MNYKLYISVFCVLLFNSISAQELNCNVQINLNQNVQTAQIDKSVFSSLEVSVREFMNNRKWTNDVYTVEERIECQLIITINEVVGTDQFKGTLQVISRRTIYNAAYISTILNFNDKDFHFNYLRNTRLDFNIDQHRTNLTSVLAYYAYMILGYDYDTYKLEGGTPYFTKAQQIVSNANNVPEPGWKANESISNRYWLIDNALHQSFKPLRKAYYEYHRLGFDEMYNDVNKGRAIVTKSMNYIDQVVKSRPGSINIQSFFRAKSQELIELYSQAFPQEKGKVVPILKKADPINSEKYDGILKNR